MSVRGTSALVLALAFVGLAGCSRERGDREAPADTSRTATAARPDTSLASRWPAAVPLLPEWIETWRVAVPGFTADSMRLASAEPLVFQYERPIESSFEDLELRRRHWWVPSPDGRWAVDPNTGVGIVREGDGIGFARDVDSEVALVDLEAGLMKRVLFCGTPCSFDGARWIATDVFLVTGDSEYQFRPWRGGPMVYVVDLGRSRLETYRGPAVDSLAFGRGLEAIRDAFHRGHPEFVRDAL
jgi:hypothetical protein